MKTYTTRNELVKATEAHYGKKCMLTFDYGKDGIHAGKIWCGGHVGYFYADRSRWKASRTPFEAFLEVTGGTPTEKETKAQEVA